MNAVINSQWTLQSRPSGRFKESDFEKQQVALPKLEANQVLLKTLYLSFDPTQRGWAALDTYLPAVALGEVMRAVGIGQVIESRSDKYKAGDLVAGLIGWQEYCLFDANPQNLKDYSIIPPVMNPELILALMLTGSTAYFGLTEIGKIKAGETLVVSGAAGATGSIAGQLGKLLGARVIGIAGGPEKCQWLKDTAHFDETIDYKSENVERRLAELCPKGVDVFFDNVGGETMDAVLVHLALGARIIMCGLISEYDKMNSPNPTDPGQGALYGIKGLGALLIARGTLKGFIVLDYANRFSESLMVLGKLHGEGKLIQAIDMQEGFDNIPSTLLRIFKGQNIGKQLLKLSDPPLPMRTNALTSFAFKLMGSYHVSKFLRSARSN